MKKYTVLYEDLVDFDLKETKSYYQKINSELTKRFFHEFRKAKNFISEFPYANDVMYGENIRLHFLKTFPYHIHYIINEEKKEVVILAVIFAKKGNLDFSERT